MIADADFPCESNGLVFCDTLAADYPKDIDCYLRDGKDRLQAEMNNPTAIVSGKAVKGFHSAVQQRELTTCRPDGRAQPPCARPGLRSWHQQVEAREVVLDWEHIDSFEPGLGGGVVCCAGSLAHTCRRQW